MGLSCLGVSDCGSLIRELDLLEVDQTTQGIAGGIEVFEQKRRGQARLVELQCFVGERERLGIEADVVGRSRMVGVVEGK